MKKLVGLHAEDVGGLIVEPGQTFDEADADQATVDRLQADGLLIDASSPKKTTKQTSEES